jgi:hypothetical protein
MAAARITVLMTAQAKTRLARRAKKAGLSLGEYFRRAATAFPPSGIDPSQECLVDQWCAATERASTAIDEALDFVDASNRRIAMMEPP